jgi:hypothetical protein
MADSSSRVLTLSAVKNGVKVHGEPSQPGMYCDDEWVFNSPEELGKFVRQWATGQQQKNNEVGPTLGDNKC